MSLLLVVGIGLGAAVLVLLARPGATAAVAGGSLGLAVAAAVLLAASPGEAIRVGPDGLVLSAYGRLFLAALAVAGLLLTGTALAAGGDDDPHASRPTALPAAALVALGALAVAVSATSPLVAVPAAAAAALAGPLVSLRAAARDRAVENLARELRAASVAAVALLLATGWTSALGGPAVAPGTAGVPAALPVTPPSAALGLVYLGVAAGVALRAGAIPFHAWATRLAATAPRPALAILLAWLPAGLLLAALGWSEGVLAPLGSPLDVERGVVLGVGLVGLVLGAVGASLQEDVELVVAYSIVQDVSLGLLALGTFDPAAFAAVRAWLVVFVVVKTAFVAWAVALHGAFGTGRLDGLRGWLRRSPPLGLALLAIVVASLGWPGLTVFEARQTVLRSALQEPARTIGLLASLAALLYYGRLAAIGLRAPSTFVAAGADWRPRLPARQAELGGSASRAADDAGDAAEAPDADGATAEGADVGGARNVEAADEPAARRLALAAARLGPAVGRLRLAVVGLSERRAPDAHRERRALAAWRLDRAPIAAGLVLLLALLGAALGAGAFDLRAAAVGAVTAASPAASAGGQASPNPGAASFAPLPTE